MTPYDDINLDQHLLWKWLVTVNHYLNQNLSSEVFWSIHLRAISQEVVMNLIRNMCSGITFLKLLPYLLGANELNPFRIYVETF